MAEETHSGNGAAAVDTVVLTLTRDPWHLEVGGKVDNLPLYRLMLLEALRVVESQLRLQDAQQLAANMQDAARTAEILRRTAHGRG